MILEFNEYSERESSTRTKGLSEEEFLDILKNECSNFSFDNDLLWRNTSSEFGDFGLYLESERKGTIGKYNYHTFFDQRKDYPVPRFKSLIGSTTSAGAELLGSETSIYLVIPFNNSQLVFTPTPDMALLSKISKIGKNEYNDDMFIMVEYLENFKIPVDFLNQEMQKTGLTDRVSDSKLKSLGFEFFTNSSCLLLSQDKVEWLRSKI
jgi:hypothetical protein